ncbi:hypothetical protein Pmani_003207 [Petrolisthes manimaculis]|uniref:Uncharacterized protein n=1 Tax=Petrolisthes manimaculis TaxID=1843537 RepID=A0AAE1UJP9_9EUCA|nr:hypothetical protein Pmani_003207 [Petrolisthes manimaculis]
MRTEGNNMVGRDGSYCMWEQGNGSMLEIEMGTIYESTEGGTVGGIGLVAMEGGGGHFGRTRDKGAPHQGASRGEMEGNIGRYISLAHCLSRPLSPTTLYHNPHF